MTNPLKYTSRTFNTILSDINSDAELADKPNWFKRIWAGVGDMLAMYINAVVNNSFLRTAFTRQAIVDLLSLIDYQLANRSTASGELTFYIDRNKFFPLTFTIDELIGATSGSVAQSSLQYKSRSAVTISTQISESVTATYATSIINVSNVYKLGDLLRINSSGTLPTPLQANVDYYVIPVTTGQIRLAASIAAAIAGSYVVLIDAGTGTHTAKKWSFQIETYQEKFVDSTIVGTSDGSAFQEFPLNGMDILEDTINISVNGVSGWTAVDSFVYGNASSKNYRILYNSDGTCKLLFGDGQYATIPVGDIDVAYSVGGGSGSNVSSLNRIINYVGGSTDISGVSNFVTFSGGADFEDLETAKILAPMALKTRDRFVTVEDGESLALNYGGISKVVVNKCVYGNLSAQVIIIPTGGGLPSSALKSALQDYLISKTILGIIDVRVEDPTYVPISVTSSMKLISGYNWSNVLPYYTLACRLFFSERGTEIQTKYINDGIASAIVLINAEWSVSFGSADYTQISKLLSTDNFIPLSFGESVQESKFLAYLQDNVDGCSYVTVAVPSFPVSISVNEHTTDGTMTLTQIT